MQSDITGQVLGVVGVPNRSGNGQRYEIDFSDGNKYTTFELPLAQRAQGLVGQQSTARVEVVNKPKRNGQGTVTYWNLLDIAGPGAALPPAVQDQLAPGTQLQAGTPLDIPTQGASSNGTGIPMQQQTDYQRDLSPEAQARVTFFAAAGAAAQFVGHIYAGFGGEGFEEALARFKEVVHQLEEQSALRGVKPPAATPVQTQPAPTPEAVAAAVPGVEVGVPENPITVESSTPTW